MTSMPDGVYPAWHETAHVDPLASGATHVPTLVFAGAENAVVQLGFYARHGAGLADVDKANAHNKHKPRGSMDTDHLSDTTALLVSLKCDTIPLRMGRRKGNGQPPRRAADQL
jgi:hypothetical protein